MTTEISTPTTQQTSMQSYCFSSAQAFEAAQRMATALSKATLVPKEYINNVPNCIIALEVAHRLNASPTMVMQNLYIVHGRPSWSSQFIISAVNSCGRFTPMQFHLNGEGDDWGCYVSSKDKSGDILKGPRVTIGMAKKEGWYNKNGSKWQTMPEMMLRYRAASFFGKLYAPDVLMGMYTQEEAEDIVARDVTPRDNTALKEAFLNPIEEEKPEVKEPNKLDELLSNKSEEAEEGVVADLIMTTGEAKKFPTEIDTIGLMTELQRLIPPDEKIFISNNAKVLPKIIEFMIADNKPLAADNLRKLINKK